jgi:hypothetical protein
VVAEVAMVVGILWNKIKTLKKMQFQETSSLLN